MDHVKCAAFELPFRPDEKDFKNPHEYLGFLEEEGVLKKSQDAWHWSDHGYPAEGISLRSAMAQNIVIINTTAGKYEVIGEMDVPSAKELIFDYAVYLHRGEQYTVQKLDLEQKKCLVTESDVNYYTDAVVKTDIKVLEEDDRLTLSGTALCIGDLLVRSQASKYKKLKFHTHENIGYGDIALPEEELHTRGVAILFEEGSSSRAAFDKIEDQHKAAFLSALGHVLLNIAPLFLYCDRQDLSVAERLRDPHYRQAALFVFERTPGGTGLSEGFIKSFTKILAAAKDTVLKCPCKSGCPSCVGVSGMAEGLKQDVNQFLRNWS
jgi:DEAD/DEAH box helicase domain-containing protein